MRVARVVLIALLTWSVGVWWIQRYAIFPSHMTQPVPDRPPDLVRGDVGQISIPDGGAVEYWFLPGAGVSAEQPGPAVLFAHGNAETIDDAAGYIAPVLRSMGVSVMLVEYRGYGRSDGSPSQAGLTEDFLAGYRLLTERADVDAKRIVLFGRSIGTGVVAQVAARVVQPDSDLSDPAAVILLSPMRSIRPLARRYLVPGFLIRDPFDTESALADFAHPVLLLHGRADPIIPASHSRALHERLPHSTLVELQSGHNDVPVTSPAFRGAIRDFLQRHGVLRP